jgi:hypothetical protein
MESDKPKGFAFKGRVKKVEKAPEIFRDEVKETGVKPSKITTAVKAMFSKPVAPVSVQKPKPTPKPKQLNTNRLKEVPVFSKETSNPTILPGSITEDGESKEDDDESNEESKEDHEESNEEATTTAARKFTIKKRRMSADLEEMGELIRKEESRNPYELPAPTYVPESRRGFSEFIKTTYDSFMLDATPSANPTPSGEKYPYQKFIREYMRNESPYRGILTYHGLGSGKTCTAIAASEALYSTANKKIIVMTPFSLRKNFLKEVSLCGFRHFRLNNFWTSLPVDDDAARLFATSVLGIPESHLRTANLMQLLTADE